MGEKTKTIPLSPLAKTGLILIIVAASMGLFAGLTIFIMAFTSLDFFQGQGTITEEQKIATRATLIIVAIFVFIVEGLILGFAIKAYKVPTKELWLAIGILGILMGGLFGIVGGILLLVARSDQK